MQEFVEVRGLEHRVSNEVQSIKVCSFKSTCCGGIRLNTSRRALVWAVFFLSLLFLWFASSCSQDDPGTKKLESIPGEVGGEANSEILQDAASPERSSESEKERVPEKVVERSLEKVREPAIPETRPEANPVEQSVEPEVEKESARLQSLSGGVTRLTIKQEVQGQVVGRQVLIQTSSAFDPVRKYPIFFAFHGNGGRADNFVRSMAGLLKKNEFIGVYPQGLSNSWNLGKERSKADDVAFVTLIMDELRKYKNFDFSKVYGYGNSNGAGMVHKIAIESQHFKAIAPVVTQLLDGMSPTSSTPNVSVLQISGMKDPLIPYQGGPSKVGHSFVSAEKSSEMWAKHNGCSIPGKKTTTPQGDTKIEFVSCSGGVKVLHFGVKDAGHRIPGNFQGGLLAFIWNFLKSTP